jgi:hypothetical protein
MAYNATSGVDRQAVAWQTTLYRWTGSQWQTVGSSPYWDWGNATDGSSPGLWWQWPTYNVRSAGPNDTWYFNNLAPGYWYGATVGQYWFGTSYTAATLLTTNAAMHNSWNNTTAGNLCNVR